MDRSNLCKWGVATALVSVAVVGRARAGDAIPVTGSYVHVLSYSGAGLNVTLERFASGVEDAYARDFGGVLDGSVLGGTYSFGAGLKKALNVEYADIGVGLPGPQVSPISRPDAFGATGAGKSGTVFFKSIGGGIVGEAPVEVGLVATPDRNINYGLVTVRAGLDDGGVLSGTRTINANPNGSGNTFFGFTAPAGRYITSLGISHNAAGTNPIWFDDIGFRTAVVTSQRLEQTPKVMAEAGKQGNTAYVLDPMEPVVRVGKYGGTNPREYRGILEYDISSLKAGSRVSSAVLALSVAPDGSGTPMTFSVIGYEGDGVALASDATQGGPVVGSAVFSGNGHDTFAEIWLDAAYIESLAGKTKYMGLLVTSLNEGFGAGLWSLRSGHSISTLTIDYNAVPEPAGGLLVGMGMFLVMRRRR